MEPANSKSFSQGAASDQVADKSSESGGIVGTQAGATVGGVSDGVFRQKSQSAPQSVQGLEPAPQPVQGLEPTPRPVQGLEPALREKPQSVSGPVQNPGFASLASAQSISQPEQSSEPTPQEDSNQVSQQEQKPGHMTDEEFYASFSNPAVPVNSAEGDIILNNGVKRRKKGLIIGAIVAGVGLVVGLMVFIFVVLPAMDPKTGDGIKAKNYQEAFNIYANYFLFGERSKEAVDWDATRGDEFESYYEKVLESPFKVESLASGQETVGNILSKMDGDFSGFQSLFSKQENRPELLVEYFDKYGKMMKFMDKYYNVGLPIWDTVFDVFVEKGYDGADDMIGQLVDAYREVGTIYDYDVADLIGRYGTSQLSMIEEYNKAGCLIEDKIDFDCTVRNAGAVAEYSNTSIESMKNIDSLYFNTNNDLINEFFGIQDYLENIGDEEGEKEA